MVDHTQDFLKKNGDYSHNLKINGTKFQSLKAFTSFFDAELKSVFSGTLFNLPVNGGKTNMATCIKNQSKLDIRVVIRFLYAKGN